MQNGNGSNALTTLEQNEEVLSSSDSILTGNFGKGKSLQQFFTPPEVARFLAYVLNAKNIPVLDIMAGSGNLLEPYDRDKRYGIEISPEYAIDANYNVIKADTFKLIPIAQEINFTVPCVVCNPAFGLQVENQEGDNISSTKLAFQYSNSLMSGQGQMAFIAGKDRIDRELLKLPEWNNVYARIDVMELFGDSVSLPCSILFLVGKDTLKGKTAHCKTFPTLQSYHELTEYLAKAVIAQRNYIANQYMINDYFYDSDIKEFQDTWKAIGTEYRKRTEKRLKRDNEYSIYLKNGKIAIHLTAFDKVKLHEKHPNELRLIESISGNTPKYFGLHRKDWKNITQYEKDGIITVDPKASRVITEVMIQAERELCPLYEVNPVMRLGWLDEVDEIPCIKSDSIKGYKAGEKYPVNCRTERYEENLKDIKYNEKTGEAYEADKVRIYQRLVVSIGNNYFYEAKSGEKQTDLLYLIEHFQLPNPESVQDKFPHELKQWEDKLIAIQEKYTNIPREGKSKKYSGWKFKNFQVTDLAKVAFKKGGLLAWDTGLGKSLGGLTFAEVMKVNNVLIIAPQDLIHQWQEESQGFYGRKLETISSLDQAIRVRKRILTEPKRQNQFITHYEAISRTGFKDVRLNMNDKRLMKHHSKKQREKEISESWTRDEKEPTLLDLKYKEDNRPIWAKMLDLHIRYQGKNEKVDAKYIILCDQHKDDLCYTTPDKYCPNCEEHINQGKYDGHFCHNCGFTDKLLHVKPAYRQLCDLFDMVIFDEADKTQGDNSLMSLACRAFKAQYKLGMTATVISNYITSAFWTMAVSLGFNSLRFPYGYDGKQSFINKFAVVEYIKNGRKLENKRVLPQITNLTGLWKLVSNCTVRRRREDCGEVIIDKHFHPITVPFGSRQKDHYTNWVNNFPDYFLWKHPDTKLKHETIERFSQILGKLQKLQFAVTLPHREKDRYFSKNDEDMYTPKFYSVVKTAMQLVKDKRRLLIVSSLMEHSSETEKVLKAKGVKALSIVQTSERTGKTNTLSPLKRAGHIQKIKDGDIDVLLAGVEAIGTGHSIPECSAIILNGLPWRARTFYQTISRIHRLTSERDIDVYIIMTKGSVDERMWNLLQEKQSSANLAIDGSMLLQDSEDIDANTFLKELKSDWNQNIFVDTISEDFVKDRYSKLTMANCDRLELEGTFEAPENTYRTDDMVEYFKQFEEVNTDTKGNQLCLF